MEQENQTVDNQKRMWLIGAGVAAVVLIIAGILLFTNSRDEEKEASGQINPKITINQPAPGAILDITNPVTVSGIGGGLPEGNVVVQAIDRDGNVLTQQPTTIDAPDAGTGGQGPWSVQLDIDTEPGMAGRIRAFSSSPADNSVLAEAVVEVSFSRTATAEPFIEIHEPVQGAVVDIANPVTVSGFGGSLPEGNVVVQVIDRDGNILTQQPTTIDAPDAGTGGQGPWSVQLDIDTEPGMAGRIRAFSSSPADNSVLAEAVVEVSLGQTATIEPFIQIHEPEQGAVVNIANPVKVSGLGGSLPEGNVVVQAIDRNGNVLTQQPTTIDAPDAGTGGQGPWSVQLDIDTEPGMAGRIRAFSSSPADNSTVTEAVIDVTFGQVEAPSPPTAQISGPTQGQTGQILTFDGSASSGNNAIVEYTWDFGDGTGATGAQVNQEYNEPGGYNVTLTVTDEQGLTGNSSLAIQIYPVVEVPELPDLEGKDWSLVEAATFDTVPITAFFYDGTVSGFSGCNTYTGSYQSDGSSLTISGIVTTQLACDEAATTRESTYLFNLGSVNGYTVQGKQLSLTGPQPMTFMDMEQ